MPLTPPPPDTALLRFRLVVAGVSVPVGPGADSELKLTREPGEGTAGGSFYYRDKLSGPLIFSGPDFELLYALETSTARCQPIGLLVQHRGAPDLVWETWRGVFTCNECTEWNATTGSVRVNPVADDGYRQLLDYYDQEYNILLTPGTRRTVTAQLAELAAGTDIEFRRIDQSEQGDYVGTDGWALFYINQSDIYKGNFRGFQKSTDAVIFRYRQRRYALPQVPGSNPPRYTLVDRSAAGWQALVSVDLPSYPGWNVDQATVDYIKAPGIAGFRPYQLTGSGGSTPFFVTARPNSAGLPGAQGSGNGLYRYGTGEFLALDCGNTPAYGGYLDADWIEVTGPTGGRAGGSGGANNAEACGGLGLTVRQEIGEPYSRRVFWRFGNFRFAQAFPLVDGLYNLLLQTVAPFGGQSLLPPYEQRGLLSDFLTNPVNPATGASGAANEVPRLLLSAGSDVKRFGSSEAATRLLISLKQLLADLSGLYDGGWFIDPATGWLRFEHRAYLEAQQGLAAVVDTTALEDAVLPGAYGYRVGLLPRYEGLEIASGSTEDFAHNAYYGKASIDYGLGGCVNQHTGQNRLTTSVSRLTGDVPAGILNGDAVPDSALFLLAPDLDGRLSNANREVSASQLQVRYWRRGRAAFTATVEGPAPLTAPNTVTGALPVSGVPLAVQSVRPPREQVGISGALPALATLAPQARYTSNLGSGGQLGKAELGLFSRTVTLTLWLPAVVELRPPVVLRNFDQSFDKSFD